MTKFSGCVYYYASEYFGSLIYIGSFNLFLNDSSWMFWHIQLYGYAKKNLLSPPYSAL